jgi:hypothetical protein
MQVIQCQNCQREFVPTRDWQVHCSAKCRNDFHNRAKAEDRRNGYAKHSSVDLLGKLGVGEPPPVVGLRRI